MLSTQTKIRARVPRAKGEAESLVYWVEARPGLYMRLSTAKGIDRMKKAEIGFCNGMLTAKGPGYSYRFSFWRLDQLEVVQTKPRKPRKDPLEEFRVKEGEAT